MAYPAGHLPREARRRRAYALGALVVAGAAMVSAIGGALGGGGTSRSELAARDLGLTKTTPTVRHEAAVVPERKPAHTAPRRHRVHRAAKARRPQTPAATPQGMPTQAPQPAPAAPQPAPAPAPPQPQAPSGGYDPRSY